MYIQFHRCSLDPAVSVPRFPCHTGVGYLQTRTADIRDGLAGASCLGCCHEEKSGTKKIEIQKVITKLH